MMERQHSDYIAHIRQDGNIQTLSGHLLEVARISKNLAKKIDVAELGELIGLLHDFGKYGTAFQDYIRSASGMIDPD